MGKDLTQSDITFYFCDGGSCQKAGSEASVRAARAYLRNNNLWDTSHTIKTRCNGRCEDAPTCIVNPGNGEYWYKELTPEKAVKIIESHLYEKCPLIDELLYSPELGTIQSQKERDKKLPAPFQLKEDDNLGEVFITRGFHTDQYVYPFMVFLVNHKEMVTMQTPEGNLLPLTDLLSVHYTEGYTMTLLFSDQKEVPFVIGAVPKTEPSTISNSKISSVEYFIHCRSGKKGIRWKDKKGRAVALFHISEKDRTVWDYCLEIQLHNMKNPVIAKSA